MVFLSCVFLGKGVPEPMELLRGHVKDVLHLLHVGVYNTNHEQVSDVEHVVAIGKTIQVNPVVVISRQDDVAGLEVAMNTVGALMDGFNEVTDNLFVLLAYKRSLFDGKKRLFFSVWEVFRIARCGEEFLALLAQ